MHKNKVEKNYLVIISVCTKDGSLVYKNIDLQFFFQSPLICPWAKTKIKTASLLKQQYFAI